MYVWEWICVHVMMMCARVWMSVLIFHDHRLVCVEAIIVIK